MAEPLRATFFALRRRERGGVLLRATLAYAVLSSLLLGAMFLFFSWGMGWALHEWPAMLKGAQPDPPDPSRALWLLPLIFIWLFIHCVLMAAYEAGCLRWMIRNESRGWFGLTVDDDAWRVYGAYWVWAGFYLIWLIAFLLLAALLNRLLGEGHFGVWIGLGLLGLCAAASMVAFAPAAATCVAKQRFAFFESVNASEDRLPALAGSFALILGAQWLVSQALTYGWWALVLGPDWAEAFAGVADYAALQQAERLTVAAALQAPGGATLMAVTSVASMAIGLFAWVLIYGVNARAVLVALDEGRLQDDA